MSIPTTQKAVLLHKESIPYVLGERPVPQPGPQDVLVKLMACALNPADHFIVNPPFSARLIKQWPHVPGVDGAGVVVGVGADVSQLKEGDKVFFQGTVAADGATCQQYAIVPAKLTSIIPDNITFEQAATIPLGFYTAAMSLYNQNPPGPTNLSLRLKPIWEPEGATAYAGTPILILAGASSVGQYAIQLARIAGHTPIITTASLHNAPLLTSLGATHVLDRHRSKESILAELPALMGGKPLELAVVAMGDAEAMRLGRDALAPGGGLATVAPGPALGLVPEDVVNPGDGKRVGYAFGSVRLPFTEEMGVVLYKQLHGWLEKGLLKPNPVEVLPNGLAGVSDGLERMKAKKVSGMKLVARPQETP
ncbi:GroES-like protein [Trametes versicolor FP-101664 SS1]|uniref:GroES-like protein n=1 Tax=Trametes versicolor (strain FP-101664) TaxID=717944 RepID=UPI0004623F8A|nr:GroES-like protein [Trametes versicolor FP-101664 SS1]EIW58236.1 GroES-like protein [Trametes versicolor FP-101664 SS1]